jgi:hypothetical protein
MSLFSSIFSLSFHYFLLYFPSLFTIFFCVFQIFSLFNLGFFYIFHIFSQDIHIKYSQGEIIFLLS